MEFNKLLKDSKKKTLGIKQLTSDQRIQIKLRNVCVKQKIKLLIDMIWGTFVRTFPKTPASIAALKKESCAAMSKWIKSICNNLKWCPTISKRNNYLLPDKWTSITFNVQNKLC